MRHSDHSRRRIDPSDHLELSHLHSSFFVITTRHYAEYRCRAGIESGEGYAMPNTGKDILNIIREQIDLSDYRKVHWEGTFEEYLDIVRDHPDVTRTAYQRLYDMILSHGIEERYENKEQVVRYKFFTGFGLKLDDAVYGLVAHDFLFVLVALLDAVRQDH